MVEKSIHAEHVLALVAAFRCPTAPFLGMLFLVKLYHLKHWSEALVLDHRCLIDLPNFIERAISQFLSLVTNYDLAIRVVHYGNPFTNRRLGRFCRLQDE